MIWWIIALVVWLVGIYVSYREIFSKWGDDITKFEKVWFSIFWPPVIPLYLIYLIYKHMS